MCHFVNTWATTCHSSKLDESLDLCFDLASIFPPQKVTSGFKCIRPEKVENKTDDHIEFWSTKSSIIQD